MKSSFLHFLSPFWKMDFIFFHFYVSNFFRISLFFIFTKNDNFIFVFIKSVISWRPLVAEMKPDWFSHAFIFLLFHMISNHFHRRRQRAWLLGNHNSGKVHSVVPYRWLCPHLGYNSLFSTVDILQSPRTVRHQKSQRDPFEPVSSVQPDSMFVSRHRVVQFCPLYLHSTHRIQNTNFRGKLKRSIQYGPLLLESEPFRI